MHERCPLKRLKEFKKITGESGGHWPRVFAEARGSAAGCWERLRRAPTFLGDEGGAFPLEQDAQQDDLAGQAAAVLGTQITAVTVGLRASPRAPGQGPPHLQLLQNVLGGPGPPFGEADVGLQFQLRGLGGAALPFDF